MTKNKHRTGIFDLDDVNVIKLPSSENWKNNRNHKLQFPYLKCWNYDNIYLNLLTLEDMKGSVIISYEKDIETID